MHRPVIPKKVIQMPKGTFADERRKYIRAREYASRYGVGMSTAYGKVK